MKTQADYKNLRVLPSGFQVAIMRNYNSITKHFAGHTPESYAAAIRYRNKMLRRLPAPMTLRRAA